MKKVYFACSIRGGRSDAVIYKKLVDVINQHAKVLTEIFVDGKLTAAGMNKPAKVIWHNDISWIEQADAVIAEVTNPSLGVGYEIAKAETMGKSVLCLYRPSKERRLSAMIQGSPSVTVVEYRQLKTASHAIQAFLADLK